MVKFIFDCTPVSANAMYRCYNNRIIKSKKYRQYCTVMSEFLEGTHEKIKGFVEIEINLYFRDKRRVDLDNYCKSIIDCIKNILIEDDHLILGLRVTKKVGCKFSKTIVTINQVEDTSLLDSV